MHIASIAERRNSAFLSAFPTHNDIFKMLRSSQEALGSVGDIAPDILIRPVTDLKFSLEQATQARDQAMKYMLQQ